MERGEPLIVAMDAMLKYAEAYQIAFNSKLAEDCVLGPDWLEAVQGIRGLLNGDGAIAYNNQSNSDSKDNGCIESVFWAALRHAGFEEKDL